MFQPAAQFHLGTICPATPGPAAALTRAVQTKAFEPLGKHNYFLFLELNCNILWELVSKTNTIETSVASGVRRCPWFTSLTEAGFVFRLASAGEQAFFWQFPPLAKGSVHQRRAKTLMSCKTLKLVSK